MIEDQTTDGAGRGGSKMKGNYGRGEGARRGGCEEGTQEESYACVGMSIAFTSQQPLESVVVKLPALNC